MKKGSILLFTGGGLAPALNPTLYGTIACAKRHGYHVLGGMYGWSSLLDNGKIINLDDISLEPIKNIGGTFLRSSRTNPLAIKDGINQIKKNIKKHGIDCVIAVGGNDTMGCAEKLSEQEGIKIIGVPKTIDNDLEGTYWTPGFPSAAYYYANYIKEIRQDAAYALSRIFIVEAQGEKAGWLVSSGIYGNADVILPPEKEINLDNALNLIIKKYFQNGMFAVVAVSQEAKFNQPLNAEQDDQKDLFGKKRQLYISISLRNIIKEKLGVDTKALFPGNYVESGNPIEVDKKYAIELGGYAVELLNNKEFGRMVCLEKTEGKAEKMMITSKKLKAITQAGDKILTQEYFDFDNFAPKQKYLDYMEPILGKYQKEKSEYIKLIEKINRK